MPARPSIAGAIHVHKTPRGATQQRDAKHFFPYRSSDNHISKTLALRDDAGRDEPLAYAAAGGADEETSALDELLREP